MLDVPLFTAEALLRKHGEFFSFQLSDLLSSPFLSASVALMSSHSTYPYLTSYLFEYLIFPLQSNS